MFDSQIIKKHCSIACINAITFDLLRAGALKQTLETGTCLVCDVKAALAYQRSSSFNDFIIRQQKSLATRTGVQKQVKRVDKISLNYYLSVTCKLVIIINFPANDENFFLILASNENFFMITICGKFSASSENFPRTPFVYII